MSHLFLTKNISFPECFWNWSGVHHLHWSNKSISRLTNMGSIIFPNALHLRHRFTIWHIRGSRNISGWYEIIAQLAKGIHSSSKYPRYKRSMRRFYKTPLNKILGSMLFLLPDINGVCQWSWKLYLPING